MNVYNKREREREREGGRKENNNRGILRKMREKE
jgi:hypothetical protein